MAEWRNLSDEVFRHFRSGELPTRAILCLARGNLLTAEQVEKATDEEIYRISCCGRKTLADIRKVFPYSASQNCPALPNRRLKKGRQSP